MKLKLLIGLFIVHVVASLAAPVMAGELVYKEKVGGLNPYLPVSSEGCTFVEQSVINHADVEPQDWGFIHHFGLLKGTTLIHLAVEECFKKGYTGWEEGASWESYKTTMVRDVESLRNRAFQALATARN